MPRPTEATRFALCFLLLLIFGSPFFSALLAPAQGFTLQILSTLLLYGLPLFGFWALGCRTTLTGRLRWPGLWPVLVGVLLGLFLQPTLMLLSALSTLFFPNDVATALQSYQNGPFWQMAVSIALLPALLEELTFRGAIFGSYSGLPFWQGALASAALFAMSHLDGQQFFYAFVMGILLAFLAFRTGSLFPSMATHFTINFCQSTLAYVSSAPTTSASWTWMDVVQVLPLTGITLAISLGLLLFLHHHLPAPKIMPGLAGRVLDGFFWAVVAIFLFFLIWTW